MKLKSSETVFAVICLCAAIVAVMMIIVVRERTTESEITVSRYDPSYNGEVYDVAVINSASLEDFTQIGGIGQVKAGDIIAYREAIGGFTRASQLMDVNGISDALYQRIIEYFYLNVQQEHKNTSASDNSTTQSTTSSQDITSETEISSTPVTTKGKEETKKPSATSAEATQTTEKVMRVVNINSADADEIADALLIDKELAEEIISLRDRIHYFSVVQELDLCDGMTAEIYKRIKDYVVID